MQNRILSGIHCPLRETANPTLGRRAPCTIELLWHVSKSNTMTRITKELSSILLGFFLLLGTFGTAQAQSKTEITVAAAADLSVALHEIAQHFEKQTGITVKLSFGASGALTQQILNGAPFDAFLSADSDYPKQVVKAGAADDALYLYAIGKLVLWVPADSPLDIQKQGINVLLDPSVKKISIANPQHAPYGRAAVAALEHFKLYDQVKDRLVLGENVSQAAQFVESGNAQVGFVALAHAIAPAMQGKGKYWVVPPDSYPTLEQSAVVLSHSQHKKEAADFLKFLQSKEMVEVLAKYGFTQAADAANSSSGKR